MQSVWSACDGLPAPTVLSARPRQIHLARSRLFRRAFRSTNTEASPDWQFSMGAAAHTLVPLRVVLVDDVVGTDVNVGAVVEVAVVCVVTRVLEVTVVDGKVVDVGCVVVVVVGTVEKMAT